MADNYLEKRYEELFGSGRSSGHPAVPAKPSLDQLLTRKRRQFEFDTEYKVHRLQMDAIAGVNGKLEPGLFEFHPLTAGAGTDPLGRILPEAEHLPGSFIVVSHAGAETPGTLIALGMSVQTMLLKAVELGLEGLVIRDFDRDAVRDILHLDSDPVAILAIGKAL